MSTQGSKDSVIKDNIATISTIKYRKVNTSFVILNGDGDKFGKWELTFEKNRGMAGLHILVKQLINCIINQLYSCQN